MLANRIVNLAGPVFALRMKEMSGASGAEVARAFVVAEGAFGLAALKTRIDALDGKCRAGGADPALCRDRGPIPPRHAVVPGPCPGRCDDLAATIALYRAGVEALRQTLADRSDDDEARAAQWNAAGVPDDLARDIALLPLLAAAPDIALLAHDGGKDPARCRRAVFRTGRQAGPGPAAQPGVASCSCRSIGTGWRCAGWWMICQQPNAASPAA